MLKTPSNFSNENKNAIQKPGWQVGAAFFFELLSGVVTLMWVGFYLDNKAPLEKMSWKVIASFVSILFFMYTVFKLIRALNRPGS